MLVSICIPCYRSEKTIAPVVHNIQAAFDARADYEYQILLANDGSPDNTFGVIRQLCAEDDRIIGLDLSRNFGQNQALCALYANIEGDVAVFMDDDGQHPTAGIFQLLDKLAEGYDVAIAKFLHKKHSLFKRITSSMHRKIAEWAETCPKGIVYSSFIAFSKTAIDAAKNYSSPFPSIGAYLSNVTTRFANVEIDHQERLDGSSGYTLKKLIALSLTSLTSFSIIPLRLAAIIGTAVACSGFITAIVIIVRKIMYPQIMAGYTSIIAAILVVGGIIMMSLGLMGEYIGRIYMTISNKPQYFVRESLNLNLKNK